MKTLSKIAIAALLLSLLFAASAVAWKPSDLLRSPVYVRSPDMVNVYVAGAPRNVKSCEVHGIPAKVERYKYNRRVSLCSIRDRKSYRRVNAQQKVIVEVTYINGKKRSEKGKVKWDGVRD